MLLNNSLLKPGNNKILLTLFLILILAALLRLYHLPQNVGFDFDQEYAAQFAHDVVKIFPIRLIGQGLSVPGLFMGPWYFYFLVPFFAATNLHPLGGYFGSVLLGLITAAAYYFVLSQVFNRKVGLLAAFFRAFLFLSLKADWSMVPAFSSELAILLTWWLLWHLWHGRFRLFPLLGLLFGLYTSFHPILFPFYLVFVAILLARRKIPDFSSWLAFLALALLAVAPLVLFEFHHSFRELNVLLKIHQAGHQQIKDSNTLLIYLQLFIDFPRNILGFPPSSVFRNLLPPAVITLAFLSFRSKRKMFSDRFHLWILIFVPAAFVIYYLILPTAVTDYYFWGVEIIFFIYLSAIIGGLAGDRMKTLAFVVIAAVIAVNLQLLVAWWHREFQVSLADKDRIVAEIKNRQPDNLMNVDYRTEPGQQFGLGYLERYYGIDPKGGKNVPTYLIYIPYSKEHDHMDVTSGNVGLKIIR